MRRVVAYIDGFNMYHSINNSLGDDYKWIDYRKIVESYLWDGDDLIDIFLFSAEPKWNPERLIRHRSFMDVMSKYSWIRVINGNYSSVVRNFEWEKMDVVDRKTREVLRVRVQPKNFSYTTFEEKQTDVNISLYILEWAFKNYYDKAIVFSGDSDIAPAILMAKQHFPNKKFKWILPINWKGRVISRSCDDTRILNEQILLNSRLPDDINIEWVTYSSPYKITNAPLSGDIQG